MKRIKSETGEAKQLFVWSQNLKADKLVPKNTDVLTLNYNAISQACKCTVDYIHSFMGKLVDVIIDNCKYKNKATCLNIGIGQLWFHTNLTVQFKNNGIDTNTKLEDMRLLGEKSNMSMNNSRQHSRGPMNFKTVAKKKQNEDSQEVAHDHLFDFLQNTFEKARERNIKSQSQSQFRNC